MKTGTALLLASTLPIFALNNAQASEDHHGASHSTPVTEGHGHDHAPAAKAPTHTEHSHYGESTAEELQRQNVNLHNNTAGKGFGPQAPRDIDSRAGSNRTRFTLAPAYTEMNLCNIHMHENAEHKGGDFTTFAGYGDGKGFGTGYKFSGYLSAQEAQPLDHEVCASEHGGLQSGDTIEVHYVHTTADVHPGPTLGSCLSEAAKNPELRVEAQVFVVVNDPHASDFSDLTKVGVRDGFQQAMNMPFDTVPPIVYQGSTTGPKYNENGSPYEVTWSVRPHVQKVSIQSVGQWCKGNVFNEDHAHGVRNLVTDLSLLSPIN